MIHVKSEHKERRLAHSGQLDAALGKSFPSLLLTATGAQRKTAPAHGGSTELPGLI